MKLSKDERRKRQPYTNFQLEVAKELGVDLYTGNKKIKDKK